MIERYSSQIPIEDDRYYLLSDTEEVSIDFELLCLDRNMALDKKRLLVLSKPSNKGLQDLKGFAYYHSELRYFVCDRLPATLGDWSINKSTLDKDESERLLAKAYQHAPFLQIDLLQVERSRYELKKKIAQKTLADILDVDEGSSSLTLSQRCELSLRLTQEISKVHAKKDVLCRLTPDDIQVYLGVTNVNVIISNFSHCQSYNTQKIFHHDDVFTPPECRNKPYGVTIFAATDVYVLGRLLWLLWGNKTFFDDEKNNMDAFTKLDGVNERYKNKFYAVLKDMCSPCFSIRPILAINNVNKPTGVLFTLKCIAAHYSSYQPTKFDYDPRTLKPLRYIQQFSPISYDKFKCLIEQTFHKLESLLGGNRLSLTRNILMQTKDIHQLVSMCMFGYNRTHFSADHFLCQFMKVVKEKKCLDYFFGELLIENINPILLVLDSNIKLSYIQWRSAIFFDFDRTKEERENFIPPLKIIWKIAIPIWMMKIC